MAGLDPADYGQSTRASPGCVDARLTDAPEQTRAFTPDNWFPGSLGGRLRHCCPRLARLEVRDHLLAKEADGMEHLLMLRRPDGTQ
jgi:hypothetical protein